MKTNLFPALKLTLICLVLFSGLYTVVLLGIAQLTPDRGTGRQLHTAHDRYYANIAQSFTDTRYFWSRPSAVGYNLAGSGGSNKGPTNPDHLANVQARVDTFLVHHPDVPLHAIPSELVTASGSGLDPDLSPAAVLVQATRVAKARGMDPAVVDRLIADHTNAPLLGLFGPSTINILELNLALDAATE